MSDDGTQATTPPVAVSQVTTLTGVAVVVVALSRFVGSVNPELASYLKRALASAEAAGLPSVDLELLRTVISSLL